ncbi:MAG TPA: DUF1275 family protein, partial [Acidimicrobiia bacterium]
MWSSPVWRTPSSAAGSLVIEPSEDPGAPAPIAWLLAPVAGYVDAVGFIMLAGIFVANMSGNTVRFAVDIGQ